MDDERKHEVIHMHKSYSRPGYYLLWLLIPSIVFVLVVAGLFRYFVGNNQKLAMTSESEVIAVDREVKVVMIANKDVYVEVADDDLSRQKGLSGKTGLGDNEGMLFVFPSQDIRPRFWMKDMFIPIDIVWINDGKIVQIDRDVQPEPGVEDNDLAFYMPSDPIDYVLEVNAGFCEKNLIEVGDLVDL